MKIDFYPHGWKLLSIPLPTKRPVGRQWIRFLWGFDIFVGRVPFLKAIVVANALVWWVSHV